MAELMECINTTNVVVLQIVAFFVRMLCESYVRKYPDFSNQVKIHLPERLLYNGTEWKAYIHLREKTANNVRYLRTVLLTVGVVLCLL